MTSLTSPLTLHPDAVEELTNTEFSLDIPESTGPKQASIREWVMSKLERVSAAGSHNLPDFRCGAEMQLARSPYSINRPIRKSAFTYALPAGMSSG
jgi:hypothetical protein